MPLPLYVPPTRHPPITINIPPTKIPKAWHPTNLPPNRSPHTNPYPSRHPQQISSPYNSPPAQSYYTDGSFTPLDGESNGNIAGLGYSANPSTSIHPKFCNINLHNITYSLINWNPSKRMFVTKISLLSVTFLSHISQILSSMQITKEVNSHPRITPCVNMWNVTLFLFFFLCNLLNVGACICHIACEGQVQWTRPTEMRGKWSQIPYSHMLHYFYSITHPF